MAIEEFLRRAAQQQRGQPQAQRMVGGRPAIQPPAPPVVPRLVSEEEELGRDVATYEQSRGVVAHVKQYMDTSRVGQSDLTDLDEVDEQLQARLQAKFDHQVGTLSASPGSVTAPAPSPSAQQRQAVSAAAAGVAAMLSDRKNLASAIVLQEIFRRPEV
jgi:hypothetical protein